MLIPIYEGVSVRADRIVELIVTGSHLNVVLENGSCHLVHCDNGKTIYETEKRLRREVNLSTKGLLD